MDGGEIVGNRVVMRCLFGDASQHQHQHQRQRMVKRETLLRKRETDQKHIKTRYSLFGEAWCWTLGKKVRIPKLVNIPRWIIITSKWWHRNCGLRAPFWVAWESGSARVCSLSLGALAGLVLGRIELCRSQGLKICSFPFLS